MSKVKYKFNKKSLTFDRVQTTVRKRLFYFFTHLSSGVVFAAVVLVLAINFVDSPNEKSQKREIEQMKLEIAQMELAGNVEEAKMRYLSETQRTQSDETIAHADNMVKILTHKVV